MPTPTYHTTAALASSTDRPDHLTLAAFAAVAILAGGNAVAIKLGYAELAPFWSAALRFLSAAGILLVVMAVMRLSFPSGRALTGVVIYGFLSFGMAYFFAYWALREVSAGTAMVILAIVPLLTFILAVVQRVERFRTRGLVGAVFAAIGIVFIFRAGINAASPTAWGAVFAGALCMAQGPIVVKRFPRVHPVVENALGMAIGGALLLLVSLLADEPRVLPTDPRTQLSLAYLIVGGSIGVFVLFLFVVGRWTASGASYVMLIAPLVTVALGAAVLGETISWVFVVGGVAVLAGVYVGAFRRHREENPAAASGQA